MANFLGQFQPWPKNHLLLVYTFLHLKKSILHLKMATVRFDLNTAVCQNTFKSWIKLISHTVHVQLYSYQTAQ